MGCSSCQQSHLKSASIKITNRLTNQVMKRSLLFSFMERTRPVLKFQCEIYHRLSRTEKLRQPARLQLWILFCAIQSHSEVLSLYKEKTTGHNTEELCSRESGNNCSFFSFSSFCGISVQLYRPLLEKGAASQNFADCHMLNRQFAPPLFPLTDVLPELHSCFSNFHVGKDQRIGWTDDGLTCFLEPSLD